MKSTKYLRINPTMMHPFNPEAMLIDWDGDEPTRLRELYPDSKLIEFGPMRVVFDYADSVIAIERKPCEIEFINLPYAKIYANWLYQMYFDNKGVK
jgi:hypothetical protein